MIGILEFRGFFLHTIISHYFPVLKVEIHMIIFDQVHLSCIRNIIMKMEKALYCQHKQLFQIEF